MKALARLASSLFAFIIVAVLLFILFRGLTFSTSTFWPQLLLGLSGTLSAAALALAFALPLGLSAGVVLSELRAPGLKRLLTACLHAWAGLPSLVIGLLGLVLASALQRFIPDFRPCLLLSALCLAILITPFLICAFERCCTELRALLRLQCQALGLSWWTAFWRIGLPLFLPRAADALLLAFARACEDTAVVLLTGAAFGVGALRGLFLPFETSSFQIFYLLSEARSAVEREQLFATVLALVLTLFILMCAARFLAQRRLTRC